MTATNENGRVAPYDASESDRRASATATAGHAYGSNLLVPAALRGTLRDYSLPTTLEWPPIAMALARGERPRLTRRGWRAFWAWRLEQAGAESPVIPDAEAHFVAFIVGEAVKS